ncbi:MAG: hypothetical protein EBT94_11310 [Alphaproteobacteria bacterium]|nr:hypothetical protein [Alphaproteobacteria bacterium]
MVASDFNTVSHDGHVIMCCPSAVRQPSMLKFGNMRRTNLNKPHGA